MQEQQRFVPSILLYADKSSKKELKSLKTCLDESGMILAYKQMFYVTCRWHCNSSLYI